MANQLLNGTGVSATPAPDLNDNEDDEMARRKADPKAENARAAQAENQRCFLYSDDCPGGKIFKGADAIAAAAEDGWRDTPEAPAKAPAADGKGKK